MVVLGRVTAPFGVRGWVRVQPFADDPVGWCGMSHWWVGEDTGAPSWVEFELRDCRGHGGALVAWLRGIDDRTAAEALKGSLVAAPRQALPATAEDEYYWADLIGLAVITEEGEPLGRVKELIGTGAHDVLVVAGAQDGRERLLPFVDAVVRDVDLSAGVIRVSWQRDW